MTSQNGNHFKYQLNINKDKFPELCQKLEYAKDRVGGIAWYLRSLVERDIRENGLYNFKFNEVVIDENYRNRTKREPDPVEVVEVTKAEVTKAEVAEVEEEVRVDEVVSEEEPQSSTLPVAVESNENSEETEKIQPKINGVSF